MGATWVKNSDGVWVTGLPAVHNATGWVNGNIAYRKSGTTTWTQYWQRDTVPPAAVATIGLQYNASLGRILTTLVAPSTSDVKYIRLKVSRAGYPSTPTTADENYYSAVQPDGSPWSNILVSPSQTVTRPLPYATGTLLAGATYYYSAWAIDSSGNVSTVVHDSIRIPIPTTPHPTTVTKSAYFQATDSASYSEEFSSWRTSDNYVYQAGSQDWRGLWMYSSQITSALRNATAITDMKIYIGRVNSAHGVSAGAQLELYMHQFSSQPAGDPLSRMAFVAPLGQLNRGEYGTYTIPTSAWDNILDGSYRGFGLRYNNTSYTDNHYLIAYGAGTNSGRLWIEWTE